MARQQTEDAVEAIVTELLARQSEIELVDVEYVKERDWYLRVYIDKEGGIDIEDCQEISDRLEERLDAADLIAESYILEVSSPGIDRVLRKPRDYVREMGKAVDVTLYVARDGKKQLTGTLTAFADGVITLDDSVQVALADAAQVRLHIDI